jgi:hypothetical protein
MALSLSCPCGARFEVEETFAGQTVTCPECQQPLQATQSSPQQVRTSGFALASTVVGLMLAFTGFGTVLAVLLGIIGLIAISRARGQIAGTGYAIFGIVWGVIFTGVFAFAVTRGEIFTVAEGIRERFDSDLVDRSGPMEVRRPDKGFAITRPSAKWGVARSHRSHIHFAVDSDLMLVNAGRKEYISVRTKELFNDWEDPKQDYLDRYVTYNADLRSTKDLDPSDIADRSEIVYDLRKYDQSVTVIARLVKPFRTRKVYIIECWCPRQRFRELESDLRRGLDSFQLIQNDE